MTQDDTDLGRLGRVAPPAHDVLDAAREVLWAAVAQEMLSAGEAAGQAGETGSRRAAQRQKDQRRAAQRKKDQRQKDQRQTDQSQTNQSQTNQSQKDQHQTDRPGP